MEYGSEQMQKVLVLMGEGRVLLTRGGRKVREISGSDQLLRKKGKMSGSVSEELLSEIRPKTLQGANKYCDHLGGKYLKQKEKLAV